MALFKILKGNAKNLEAQSKTDGWAWFTPDNGNFFIDALNSDGVNIDRIQINPKSITIEAKIDGSGSSLWDLDSKTFPIINTDINENYNGYVTINTSDFNLTKQATLANFQVIEITNGSLIIQARGTLPTNTIPVIITLVPAPTPIYYTVTINSSSSNYEDGGYSGPSLVKEHDSLTFSFNQFDFNVQVFVGDEKRYDDETLKGQNITIENITDHVIIYFQGE